MISNDDWKKAMALRKTRRNLVVRQRNLIWNLRRSRTKFRKDPSFQTELRRVAALCIKLGEKLHNDLANEVVVEVMAS